MVGVPEGNKGIVALEDSTDSLVPVGSVEGSLDIRGRVPAGAYTPGRDGRRTLDVAATGPPYCPGKGVPREGVAVAGRLVRNSEPQEASAQG